MRQSIGIEIIRLGQLGTLADRREHIIEAHLIPDLRAELEPTKIEVAPQAYGQEVVKRTMQQRAFLVVGKVVTYTHTARQIGAVVAGAHSCPLERDRNLYRQRQQALLGCTTVRERFAALVLVGEGSRGELQGRGNTQVKILSQTHIRDEPYGKARQEMAHTSMVNLAVLLHQ